jgi:hypothetical protein
VEMFINVEMFIKDNKIGFRYGLYCKINGHGPNHSMITGPRFLWIKRYKMRRIMFYLKNGTCYNLDFSGSTSVPLTAPGQGKKL